MFGTYKRVTQRMFNTYSKAGTKNILLILKKQVKFEIHYSGYAMKVYSYSWIDECYNQFAWNGPSGIVIENIAAKLSISKSNFYHHFGNNNFISAK